MTPYPGTSEYNKAKKHNRILTYDWSEYYPRNPNILLRPNINNDELYKIYKEIFVKLEQERSQRWILFLARNPKIFVNKLKSNIAYNLALKSIKN